MSDETKLTRTKQRWAQEGRFLTGRVARPDTERLPPGQHLVSVGAWTFTGPSSIRPSGTGLPIRRSRKSRQCRTSTASPLGPATTTAGPACEPRTCCTPCSPVRTCGMSCCKAMTATPPTCRSRISPPRAPCLPMPGRVRRLPRPMAARCGWSCRTCISGKARSGCSGSSSAQRTVRATGKHAATTTAGTLGPRNAYAACFSRSPNSLRSFATFGLITARQ